MDLTNKYKRLSLSSIFVDRENRQRKKISTENIKDSIEQKGVLSPILVTRDCPEGFQAKLIAGERRYTASLELALSDIPCRFLEDLSPIEMQQIELEENVKRSDLTWQEQAQALERLHALYLSETPDWTQDRTAKATGFSPSLTSTALRVAKDLKSPSIAGAVSLTAAYNILTRVDDRKMGDAVSEILEAGNRVVPSQAQAQSQGTQGGESNPTPPKPKESILNVNFLEWAPTYSGRPFNLIHCDFPYGINAFGGALSGRDKWETYNDDPDIYWALIKGLCQNLDKLMSHSAHMLFWFSLEHYQKTLDAFRELAPSLDIQVFPLIWLKSDNVGILPDPKRGPRRIYETCFLASREDRFILKAVSNAYSAPTNKDHHPSTKPEPVLRHFMSMLVDTNTRMLDPTCGSGSSLRAAESLGAEEVLGLEISKEHCESAKSALRSFRALRAANKGVKS